MKIITFKNSLVAALILIIVCLLLFRTCKSSAEALTNPVLDKDTVFLSQWRKERKEKQALVVSSEKRIAIIQQENKLLRQSAQLSKQQLYSYRQKSDSLKDRLQIVLHHATQKDSSLNDTLVPLINYLSNMRDSTDIQCDTTIAFLEKGISKRDTIILLQERILNQLKEFNEDEILQNNYLTTQLQVAYKQQKKKIRQNKILTGGLLILSGIATSLLIIQTKK